MADQNTDLKNTQTEIKPLVSLADINALCRERRKVEFEFKGRKCALEVRALTPAEQSKVAGLIDAVTPPLVKGRTQEEDRLDVTNAKYVADKNEAATKARSMALYWGVPAFSEGRPGLTDPSQINAYVQELLTEPILDNLWNGVQRSGEAGLADLVNFT